MMKELAAIRGLLTVRHAAGRAESGSAIGRVAEVVLELLRASEPAAIEPVAQN
jgi:hypothetical protein